jgi:hypothetical protein
VRRFPELAVLDAHVLDARIDRFGLSVI